MTMLIWIFDNCENKMKKKFLSLSIDIIIINFERLRVIKINSLRWCILRVSTCEFNNYFMTRSIIDQIYNSRWICNWKCWRNCLIKKISTTKSRLKKRLWSLTTWLLMNFKIANNRTMFRCHYKLICRKIVNILSIIFSRKLTSLS